GESLTDAFHILSSALQYNGCVTTENGFQHTLYTSVFDAEERAYYYNTYYDFALRKREIKIHGEMEFHPL
ncbi:MAG: linear amide C-N hydrolase, partial [Clostridia bacterium]|nr:linear amide C-N hydrolase [Clostridia bacterium]